MFSLTAFSNWLHDYEFIAIWLEGIALVAILLLDWWTRVEEHRETIAQLDIARKQIHSDRVAEIWNALRRFVHFVVHGQLEGKVGPGRDFSEHGNIGMKGGKIFQFVRISERNFSSLFHSPFFLTHRPVRS